MRSNYFEIIVGTFVLLYAIFFAANSFKGTTVNNDNGYYVLAKFNNIDGIALGSDVKIAGVKVGHVAEQTLDKMTFQAVLKISLNSEVQIPLDSSIKVASEGLLGSKFLQISPGADPENLGPNDEIEFTQSSVSLEDLLGKFIFNSSNEGK